MRANVDVTIGSGPGAVTFGNARRLGFIIGPGLERALRQALILGGNDWSTLIATPLSTGIYLGAFGLIVLFWLFTRARPLIPQGERAA